MKYAPYIIVLDIESLKKETNENYSGSMQKIAEEEPNSFSYTLHWIDTDETWGPYVYRGPNVTEKLIKQLDNEVKRINNIFTNSKSDNKSINGEDLKKFNKAKEC